MAIAPQRSEIGIRRHFTTEGVHPYDEVRWERRDARITNYRDGAVAFEQLGVEVPESWSVNATNILAQKYFRGTLGTPERETSLRQVADRVVDTLTAWGIKDGYFVDDEEAEIFNHELKYLIIHQKAAFNSPVWFNIGVHGVPQQGSACQPYHSLVTTPDGLIPIGQLVEDDAVGAKVFDAEGITRIVATKHNGRKPVLRIHTKAGHQLDVTGDHLVWRATSATTGTFVPAAELRPGDKLSWHRTDGHGLSQDAHTSREVAEAALAGWLQSDGFVGQYEGTNRSLTIEAMTVTDAELRWVTAALDEVFPSVHRHERTVNTIDQSLDCRRTRLYGHALSEFVERWDLRTRGLDMTVPPQLFTAPLPVVTAYLRSIFQAEGYVSIKERGALVGVDMISEGIVRGIQALLDSVRHFLAGAIQGRSAGGSEGLLVADDSYPRGPHRLCERDRFHRPEEGRQALEEHRTGWAQRAMRSSASRSTGSKTSARWTSTTSRPRVESTSAAASACTTASSSRSRTPWTRSSTGTPKKASSSRAARAQASTSRASARPTSC